MVRRRRLEDDGIRDLLEDLELEDLGEEDMELPDWGWGEDNVEILEEVTYVNGVEVARIEHPRHNLSPSNRYCTSTCFFFVS